MRPWPLARRLMLLAALSAPGALGEGPPAPLKVVSLPKHGELSVTPAGGRYFAGEKVQRYVSFAVGEDLGKKVVCNWATALLGDQTIESGSVELSRVAGLAQGQFVTEIPNVNQRLPFTLALQVYSDRVILAGREFQESVFPDVPVPLDPGRIEEGDVGLFDPLGATAEVLSRMRVSVTDLSSLLGIEAFGGRVIVIGEGAALARAPASLLLAVERARQGASVLVLAQENWPPRYLRPVWLSPPGEATFSGAEPLSTQPDLVRDLQPGDLEHWRLTHHGEQGEAGGFVSWGGLAVPERGNFRLHLGVPRAGMTASPLIEYQVGEGRLLLTTLPVVAGYDADPAARILMRNLLLLATAPARERKRAAFWGDPKGTAVRWLTELGVHAQPNLVNLGETDVLLIDGSSALSKAFPKHEAEMERELERFVRQGGLALILAMTAETLPNYRPLLPQGLTLRRTRVEQVLFERKEPVLWGVPQATVRSLVVGCGTIDLPEFEPGEKAEAVARPPVLARFPLDRGLVLLLELPLWEMEDGEASRLLSQILTNLGVLLTESKGPEAPERSETQTRRVTEGKGLSWFLDVRRSGHVSAHVVLCWSAGGGTMGPSVGAGKSCSSGRGGAGR